MVNLVLILMFLFPAAIVNRDFQVCENGDRVIYICQWDQVKLGPQPSTDMLQFTATSDSYLLWELTHEQKAKVAAIQAKDAALISAATFAYDGSTFALDPASREKWGNIYLANAIFTYPLGVTRADGSEYEIRSSTDAIVFYATGMATVRAFFDSGRTLTKQVQACADAGCVDAVKDSR